MNIMNIPSLALDIDGVLANFPEAVIDRAHFLGVGDSFPISWRDVKSWELGTPRFHDVMRGAWGSVDFWSAINPMPGVIRCVKPGIYLTSRPIPSDVTTSWLSKHGFPESPVVTVQRPEEKIKHLQERGLFLVDDYHETVQKCIDSGIEAYLYKAPYQRSYDVSHLPTVTSLQEVIDRYEGNN